MAYSAKVLKDSVSPTGQRLTTMEVTIPRIVLAEFNTHRTFSRNSASSRAIPVSKMLERVEKDPFEPVWWGRNQRGMQAAEQLSDETDGMYPLSSKPDPGYGYTSPRHRAQEQWRTACRNAVEVVKRMQEPDIDLHKQIANRLLEPFLWQTIIVTATEWENFFALRCHKDAQPEIRKGAEMMLEAYNASCPHDVAEDDWHLPLVDDREQLVADGFSIDDIVKVSVGRCARVSYLTHDGKRDPRADVELYERLHTGGHMSPLEHVARPMTALELDCLRKYNVEFEDGTLFSNVSLPGGVMSWESLVVGGRYRVRSVKEAYFLGNLNGWVQARKQVKHEENFLAAQQLREHELQAATR